MNDSSVVVTVKVASIVLRTSLISTGCVVRD